MESLKVTGRSSSVVPCRMSVLTHGGPLILEPLFFFTTCSVMGF